MGTVIAPTIDVSLIGASMCAAAGGIAHRVVIVFHSDGGRARSVARLGLRVGQMTLLRMVRALPDPEPDAVTGSVIIDI